LSCSWAAREAESAAFEAEASSSSACSTVDAAERETAEPRAALRECRARESLEASSVIPARSSDAAERD
jgi:hypothetical protein